MIPNRIKPFHNYAWPLIANDGCRASTIYSAFGRGLLQTKKSDSDYTQVGSLDNSTDRRNPHGQPYPGHMVCCILGTAHHHLRITTVATLNSWTCCKNNRNSKGHYHTLVAPYSRTQRNKTKETKQHNHCGFELSRHTYPTRSLQMLQGNHAMWNKSWDHLGDVDSQGNVSQIQPRRNISN